MTRDQETQRIPLVSIYCVRARGEERRRASQSAPTRLQPTKWKPAFELKKANCFTSSSLFRTMIFLFCLNYGPVSSSSSHQKKKNTEVHIMWSSTEHFQLRERSGPTFALRTGPFWQTLESLLYVNMWQLCNQAHFSMGYGFRPWSMAK